MMKAHYAVAGFEFLHACAHFHGGAGKLVAENLRWRDVAMLDFLDVRAADPAGCDAEQHFAFADFGDRDGFDDDAALAAVDAGAHVAQRADWSIRGVDWSDCLAHFPVVKIAFYLRLEIFRSLCFNYLTSILIPDLRLEIRHWPGLIATIVSRAAAQTDRAAAFAFSTKGGSVTEATNESSPLAKFAAALSLSFASLCKPPPFEGCFAS